MLVAFCRWTCAKCAVNYYEKVITHVWHQMPLIVASKERKKMDGIDKGIMLDAIGNTLGQ